MARPMPVTPPVIIMVLPESNCDGCAAGAATGGVQRLFSRGRDMAGCVCIECGADGEWRGECRNQGGRRKDAKTVSMR